MISSELDGDDNTLYSGSKGENLAIDRPLDLPIVWCWGLDTYGELGAGTISGQICETAADHCRPSPGHVVLGCP